MHSGTILKTFAAVLVAATTLAGMGSVANAADKVVVAPPTPQWNLLFGATVVSQYITRGLAQTTGVAFQPWAELDIGPFYAGYWGSNVSSSLVGGGTGHTAGVDGANIENDLSIGVRPMLGPASLDLGYVRYIYDNGDCCGELYAKGTISPIMPLTLGASIFYNPDGPFTYVEGNAKVALIDKWTASGAVGSQDGVMSWNAGVTYAPLDFLSFDARYHSGPTANKFVVGVSFSTSLQAVSGGHY